MGKNKNLGPTPSSIDGSGGIIVIIGWILAAIGAFIAIITLLNSGDAQPVVTGGLMVIFGLLFAIAGYCKRMADATTAMHYLAYKSASTSTDEPAEHQA